MGGLEGLHGLSRKDMNLQRAGLLHEDRSTVQEARKLAEADMPVQESRKERGVDRDRWYWNPGDADPEAAALEFIEKMKQDYPGIVFHMSGSGEDMDFAGTAADFGKGMHIVVTEEFLARMRSSREEFDRCALVLAREASRLVKRAGTGGGLGVFLEKDKVAAWTASSKDSGSVLPVIQGVKDDSQTASDAPFKVSSSASVSVSGYFKKMASAHSREQVLQVMGSIQKNIMALKMAAVCGDDEQRAKASRAVRSLQKLFSRGGRKIGRLNRERLKQAAYKKAERHREEERRRELEQELKRMRSARKGADYRMLQEGAADDSYVHSCKRYRGLYDAFTQPVPAADMAMMSGTGDAAGMGGADFTSADISFSGGYSF